MPSIPYSGAMASPASWEVVRRHHSRPKGTGECGAVHVQQIAATVPVVWSLLSRFDQPQSYKPFVRECTLRSGEGGVGSVREVILSSGLPAKNSVERLDELNEERHLLSVSIIGGEHRLTNYRSTTTLDEGGGGGQSGRTVVVQSYVVDVPPGNTEAETRLFIDTIILLNLRSLARVTEKMMTSGDQLH